jgi:hypothetical protein
MHAEESMSIVSPHKRLARRAQAWISGPFAVFAAAVVTAFAALMLCTAGLSRDLALPTVSVLFFAFAGVVALVAWRRELTPTGVVTYWDVAGALTFCGICAGALVEPDQVLRLVDGAQRDH